MSGARPPPATGMGGGSLAAALELAPDFDAELPDFDEEPDLEEVEDELAPLFAATAGLLLAAAEAGLGVPPPPLEVAAAAAAVTPAPPPPLRSRMVPPRA